MSDLSNLDIVARRVTDKGDTECFYKLSKLNGELIWIYQYEYAPSESTPYIRIHSNHFTRYRYDESVYILPFHPEQLEQLKYYE